MFRFWRRLSPSVEAYDLPRAPELSGPAGKMIRCETRQRHETHYESRAGNRPSQGQSFS
jgi:hypothetical protein